MTENDKLFEQALGLSPAARDELLESLPEEQRTAVQKMLAADKSLQKHDGFLRPVGERERIEDATFISEADAKAHEKTFLSDSGNDRKESLAGEHVRYFGEYELVDEIARGGMGVVFKAKQVSLNRIVALKMILAGNLAGEEEISRFQVEAEAAAKLDHWGIVPIYEIGEHEGQHYFSMGLVDGDSLADRIRNGPLEPRQAAELCRKLAEAIAYAHANGVIHRDLKPANVLLDQQNQPKITDFGLAKQVQDDSNLTRTGAVMGTPGYMPPEQATGDSDNIGPRADVYSLGAILYAMLTGHAPFQAANVMDTLRQVMEQEPVPPRQLNPSIDRDLQTICLKCLQKSATKRYATADELCEELQRYLNGQPIIARPVGVVERTWRWCKRQPALAGLAAVVALLLLSAPFIAARQTQIAQEQAELKEIAVAARDQAEQQRIEADAARSIAETQRRRAEEEKERADAARAEVQREQERTAGLLYSTQVALAHREWLDNNPERTRQLLMACREEDRNWEWSYLDGLTRAEERLISAHGVPASVQFSPDGNQLLTRGQSDRELRLWDLKTGLQTRAKQVERLVSADFAKDGLHLLVLAGDHATWIDLESGAAQGYGSFDVRVSDARLIDNDSQVAVVFVDGRVMIYDIATGDVVNQSENKIVSDRGYDFSPDATQIATAQHTTVQVHNTFTGEIDFTISGHAMTIADFEFSPDGRYVAVADGAGVVTLTDAATGQKLQTFRVHSSGATAVEFSHDSKTLASGSQDRTVRIFDVETGEQLQVIRGHWQYITDIDFHPDGNKLATSSGDGTVRVWDIQHRMAKAPHVAAALDEEQAVHLGHEAGMESRILYGHKGPVYDVAVSANGQYVATAAIGSNQGDNQICVWSKQDASVYASFPTDEGFLHTVSFTKDSGSLVVASGGAGDAVRLGSVTVWDLASQEQANHIEGIPCMLSSATLNSQNDRLAVVYGNLNYGRLRLYSFPDCELLHDQEITGERFSDVVFSAAGDQVVTATQPGGTIAVWNANTGEQQSSWKANGAGIFRLAMSSNNVLAAANLGGTISLWNWQTQQQIAELKGHGLYCVDLDFNPDGSRLVSSSEDDTVKTWNLQTHRELLTFRDHRLSAMGCDWSADGRTIASVSRDGSLILRELPDTSHNMAEEEWLTLLEDDFERDELGPQWTSNMTEALLGTEQVKPADSDQDTPQWRIENGRLAGTLRPTPVQGGTFPAAYIGVKQPTLPRQVDISVDVILQQPMLAQIVLTNSRTKQTINPFVSMIDQPFGFQGSSVLTSRGTGEMKLLGTKQRVDLQPGTVHRFRVLRKEEDLKFWVDDQLLEHVNVSAIEADILSLGGSWSAVGDEIAFDNLVVKIPQSAQAEMRIQQQVRNWLTELMVPDLVKEDIATQYDGTDAGLASRFLASLSSGDAGSPDALLDAFSRTAIRTDASEREYNVAARQAQYYVEQVPDKWWLWSKVGLALLRAGRIDDAMQRFDMAVEKSLQTDGHVLPLVLAGRALALHEQGQQAAAEIEHRKLLDLMHTGWQSIGLKEYREELREKVPVTVDPLREQLVQKIITSDKAYWYGRNMQKWAADKSDDLTAVLGRNREPDQYDRVYSREQFMKLNGIFSTFNPPPAIHVISDQLQFNHEEGRDTARLEWVAIQKFQDMKFRFGQWFEFEKRSDKWLIVKERTWHIDMCVNGQWTIYDEAHWAKLDAEIADMTEEDPEQAATLLRALRFKEAYTAAKARQDDTLALLPRGGEDGHKPDEGAVGQTTFQLAKTHAKPLTLTLSPQQGRGDNGKRADNLTVIGEAAINTSRFEEGIQALEDARKLDPTARMPWFLTRLNRSFTGHKSVVFGLDMHPTKNVLATCHQSRAIVLWNSNTARIERTFGNAHGAHIVDLKFSHDGSKLVSIGWDNALNVTDATTGKRLQQFSGHLERLYRLERHPTQERYITSSADNTAKVWDIENNRELLTLVGHENDVMSATFSPDGHQIATASADGSIRLWDAADGKQIGQLPGHEGGVWRVDYTPDGATLVSCGRDNMVKAWDIATLKQTTTMQGHEAWIEVVKVSPDGQLAASADVDGVVFIWDLQTETPIATLRGHSGAIFGLQFHDDRLYTASSDRTIRQWDIDFTRSPLLKSLNRASR